MKYPIQLSVLFLALATAMVIPGPNRGCCSDRGQAQDPEEEVIDQLIAVVKNDEAKEAERAKACLSLGKRGPKAKRAVPEMTKFLEGAQARQLHGETVALVAEGLGGIGPEAKEAVPQLAGLLNGEFRPRFTGATEKEELARPVVAAAEALGKIGTSEAFTALAKASVAGRLPAEWRKGSVLGLGHIASNKDSPSRAKAVAQLRVVAEISTEPELQKLASQLLEKAEGKEKGKD